MTDISYSTDNYIFSYRVAGILIQGDKVLLQKPTNTEEYAFPGGQIAFGETHEQSLRREFAEEIGVEIVTGELKWVEENIFPWGDKTAQQICFDYVVSLADDSLIPLNGKFLSKEAGHHPLGDVIEFHWIPIDEVKNLKVYPKKAAELLKRLDEGIKHFVYQE